MSRCRPGWAYQSVGAFADRELGRSDAVSGQHNIGAVGQRLAVEFTGFAPGTAELQLFARDASAAARAGRRRALRHAAEEIQLRLHRTMLHHVIEVQPWSRIPERRYALIDFEA